MKRMSLEQAEAQGYYSVTSDLHQINDRRIMESMESNLGPIGCVWVVQRNGLVQAYRKGIANMKHNEDDGE